MPKREHILGPQEHLTPKKAAGLVALEAIVGNYGELPDVSDETVLEAMTVKAQELLEEQGSRYSVNPTMVLRAVKASRNYAAALRAHTAPTVPQGYVQEQLRALYRAVKEEL